MGAVIKELQAISNVLADSDSQRLRAIEGLPDDVLRAPFPGRDWSIKDTLAHLAANEALMTGLARGIATGERANVPDDFDNDRFNAESVTARRDRSTRDILDELTDTQKELTGFLGQVSPDQLARRGTHPLQGELTLPEFLTVIYSHRAAHTREIVEQARRVRRNA